MPTTGMPNIPMANYASNLSLETFRIDELNPALRTESVSSESGAVLSFNAKAGTIPGTMHLGGSEPLDPTIAIDELVGSRFEETVVASNGAKGKIIGGFYGSDAREIAYAKRS